MFLIQGVFFQKRQFLTTTYLPREGLSPVLGNGVFYSMFCGSIWVDPQKPSQLVGGLMDQFGDSLLSSIEMTPDFLRFKKKYSQREYTIDYDLVPLGQGMWKGTWKSIPSVGMGPARCILTEVPNNFLDHAIFP
jgi:hypothetical protein